MKLLIITSRFPYPIEKGDKLRIFYQLKYLSVHHDITLCALSDHDISSEDYEAIKPYCTNIHIFKYSKLSVLINVLSAFAKGLPMQVGYFFNRKIKNSIHTIIKEEKPNHIYCQLIRTASYVMDIDLPKTIDYMDTFSMGAKRWSETTSPLFRPFLRREAKKVGEFETEMFQHFNHKTIISAQDRDLLPFKEKNKVKIIPNGVDTDFFKPLNHLEKSYDLAFVGNMGYAPNIEAAKYLAHEIMPTLIQKNPKIKLLIAGARPTNEVKLLASENIIISGWVEDIREAYAKAHIFVAPLFIGTGLQNKILEAMAMGIPCITTSLVNNAIKATDNKTILIADTKEDFIQKIHTLRQEKFLQKNIATNGLSFVQKNFSWQAFVESLNNLIVEKI